MRWKTLLMGMLMLALSACATASGQGYGYDNTSGTATAATTTTSFQPPADFKKVSTLTSLPDFIPGLGTLYVDPNTLPAGPFLAYDRDGKFVSTIYMIPLSDLNAHKKFADLKAFGGKTVAVTMMYNAGHPGVPVPHYHIILWHVPPAQANLK